MRESQCASLLSAAANAISTATRAAGNSGIESLYSCRTASSTRDSSRPHAIGSVCKEIHTQLSEEASHTLDENVGTGRVLMSPLAESTGQGCVMRR